MYNADGFASQGICGVAYVAGNFSAAYSVGITFINGQLVEYEPVAGQTASAVQKGTFAFSQTTPSDLCGP